MVRLIKLSGLLLLLMSVTVQAQINNLDAETALMKQACPARWESLDTMINAEQVDEGTIWADDADFLDWQAYLTTLAQAQGLTGDDIIRMSQDELTVVTECMAQRVKVMLMLGGTPLGESGLAHLNDTEILAEQPASNDDNIVLGSMSSYPADSCLDIKQTSPEAKSGIYWIKLPLVGQQNTYRVFCEMVHAGGGWMYWGYIGGTAEATDLFTEALNGSANSCAPADGLTEAEIVALGPRSCRQILDAGNSTGDGIYQIDMDGDGASETAYCDMTTDGGGWTYLMNNNSTEFIDGSGHLSGVYFSGGGGQPELNGDWFRTYHRCTTGSSCTKATSSLSWANPIGAKEVRLYSRISGSGTTKVNGSAALTSNEIYGPCSPPSISTDSIQVFSGSLDIDSTSSKTVGCAGMANIERVSVREPANTCGQAVTEAAYLYDPNRREPVDSGQLYNVFPLNLFPDTEMAFVLDSPDIQYAQYQNKYVQYRYAVDSEAFNNGPLPCQGLNEIFEYSKDNITFYDAKIGSCEVGKWYPVRTGNGQQLTIIRTGNRGVRCGSAMCGTSDTYYHNAWVYVR